MAFQYNIDGHEIVSPQQLTPEEINFYRILLGMGFTVVQHANGDPTAVLFRNGIEVCLIDTIVAYIDVDDEEEVHRFDNLNEFIEFANNH